MPRFSYIAALAMVTLLSGPISAQTAPKSPLGSSRIEDVAVREGDAVEVEIHTSGAPVAPESQAITGPDRIIVDFPGALPAAAIRALALKMNSGALKGIRTGLFFNNPPITRVVLDLSEAQSYQISTTPNAIVVKLGPAKSGSAKAGLAKAGPAKSDSARLETVSQGSANISIVRTPRIANAVVAGNTTAAPPTVNPDPTPAAVETAPPPPPPPPVTVTFVDGMLSIHSQKATLAQVLFEVQQRTQAEIAIPAGAEQEQVISDLGPAPAREVLASLLNGSPYNFIFVGNELNLERVIITKRDPNIF